MSTTDLARLIAYVAYCGICCRHTEHAGVTCTVCGT